MHYNIVHNRNIGTTEEPQWITFEEPDWVRTDQQALADLAELFAGIDFDIGTIEAIDGTLLIVMYNDEAGWRVVQIRN